MPNINIYCYQSVQQINLKAMGINFPAKYPRRWARLVLGCTRLFVADRIGLECDPEIAGFRRKRVQASQFSYQNSRDIVVLAVGNAYLKVVSDTTTVDSQKAQLNTSQSLSDRAVDKRRAGLSAQIDEMRAKVELQTQQQRLISAQNKDGQRQNQPGTDHWTRYRAGIHPDRHGSLRTAGRSDFG